MKRAVLLALLAALAACGKKPDPTETAVTAPTEEAMASLEPVKASPVARIASRAAPLPERFDCLRMQGAMVIAAHRGGPTRDYPENAIETFERTRKAATRVLEVDISQSRDGVLFMFHDDDLDRLTHREGKVADTDWKDIRTLKLRTASTTTSFSPPTLDAALDWAVGANAVLELDKKRSTEFGPIIAAVQARNASDNVVIITYTDAQAVEVHRLAPNLMIAATIRDIAQYRRLVSEGVRSDRLIAWTGNQTPNPALWKALAEEGVESSFGTLGARGERLDDVYWEDGRGDEYHDLAESGLGVLSTDFSDKVARVLSADDKATERCGF